MATALKSLPPSTPTIAASAAANAQPSTEPKGLATDWTALVIWTLCFGFMALLYIKDLLASLFR